MWDLDCEEGWVPKNWCFWTVVLENTLESLLDCKEIQPSILKEFNPGFLWKEWGKAETPVLWPPHAELTHWKRLWCWEGLRAGGEGNDRGWDIWMASLTRWTWVWINSGSWWWTGRPDMLWFMGSQRVWQDWSTETNQRRFKESYSKWKNPTFASCLTIGKQRWKIHLFKNIYLLSFQVKSKKTPAKPSSETHSDMTLTHPHQWFRLGPWIPPCTNRLMSAWSAHEFQTSNSDSFPLL